MTPFQKEIFRSMSSQFSDKYDFQSLLMLGLVNESRAAETCQAMFFSGKLHKSFNEEGSDFIVEDGRPFAGFNECKIKSIHQDSSGSYKATISNLYNKRKAKAHLHMWLQHEETKKLFKFAIPFSVWSTGNNDADTLTISMTKYITKNNRSQRDAWSDEFIYEIWEGDDCVMRKMPVWFNERKDK